MLGFRRPGLVLTGEVTEEQSWETAIGQSWVFRVLPQSEGVTGLLKIVGNRSRVAAGEFEVLDARLTAGVANPPAFAQQWTARFNGVLHTMLPAVSHPSAQGELRWIRFRVTLSMPEKWRTSKEFKGVQAKCAE